MDEFLKFTHDEESYSVNEDGYYLLDGEEVTVRDISDHYPGERFDQFKDLTILPYGVERNRYRLLKFLGQYTTSIINSYRKFDKYYVILRSKYQPIREAFSYITADDRPFVMYNLLAHIHLLHSVGVAHMNINKDTILINNDTDIVILNPFFSIQIYEKLREFDNISRRTNLDSTLIPANYEADIWSAGLIFLKLLNKSNIFGDRDVLALVHNLIELYGTSIITDDFLSKLRVRVRRWILNDIKSIPNTDDKFNETFEDVATADEIDLLKMMLHPDSRKRASVVDCLNHPYFNEIYVNNAPIKEDFVYVDY